MYPTLKVFCDSSFCDINLIFFLKTLLANLNLTILQHPIRDAITQLQGSLASTNGAFKSKEDNIICVATLHKKSMKRRELRFSCMLWGFAEHCMVRAGWSRGGHNWTFWRTYHPQSQILLLSGAVYRQEEIYF